MSLLKSELISSLRALFSFVMVVMVSCLQVQSQPICSREYQIKAAFLFNFTQFVEWPASAYPTSTAPFIIGIIGDDPFGPYLDKVIQNEQVNGHPLAIQRYKCGEDIRWCHILFVNLPKPSQLEQLLPLLEDRSTLTVGDTPFFARKGGMIRFFTDQNKTRFQINLETAKAAHLTISSKLLRLAEIVPPKNK